MSHNEVRIAGDVVSWLTDLDFQIRGAMSLNPADGSTTLRVRDTCKDAFRDLITWPMEEEGSAVAFCEDGESLYVTVIPENESHK